MTEQTRGRVTLATLALLAFLFVGAFLLAGWALYDRFEQTNARRTLQTEFNQRVRRVAFDNCIEIELLKQGFREEARRSYRNLSTNLKLLGITETAGIRAAALESRNRKLDRYQKRPCPRPALPAP